ncbi:hypothetical protein [Mycolicibacterium sarraceniae]|nr:hypothetical protein [Mycolicibacterium sarraceniae]
MRHRLRYVFPFLAAAAAAFAPAAGADTTLISPSVPSCVDTGGSSVIGGQTTHCATPGYVQANATPEVPEDLAYPWGGGVGGHGGGGR